MVDKAVRSASLRASSVDAAETEAFFAMKSLLKIKMDYCSKRPEEGQEKAYQPSKSHYDKTGQVFKMTLS